MTAIKPPSGSGTTTPPTASDAVSGAAKTPSTPFAEHVDAVGSTGAAAPADPMQAVVAELRSGAITPDAALEKMTQLAIQRSGAPESMRAAVQAHLRELLRRDPVLSELVARMGAQPPSER